MDFTLSAEQQGLVDSTRALLIRRSPISLTRSLAEGGADFDGRLWREAAELGLTAIGIGEDVGGLGLGAVEQTLVSIELGRHLATTPFVPTVVAADVLARRDVGNRAVREALLLGDAVIGWAFAERSRPWAATAISTQASPTQDGYRLTGAKAHVDSGNSADWLLVDARLQSGELARFLVPADAPGIIRTRQANLDVTRGLADITFDDVPVEQAALLVAGDSAASGIERSLHLGTVLTSAELVGLGAALLDMTVEYVKSREQFGRPVGSFQAVKQKCADMRIWLQAATATTCYAAMALDAATSDVPFAVSAAKSYASDAVNRLAGEALQLHGGIGFTWEHDLHLYLRRIRTNSVLFGDATHHRELLCRSATAPNAA